MISTNICCSRAQLTQAGGGEHVSGVLRPFFSVCMNIWIHNTATELVELERGCRGERIHSCVPEIFRYRITSINWKNRMHITFVKKGS